MELEHNTWYGLSHPHEGDIFYPVFVVDDEHMLLDDKHERLDSCRDANFTKAIMPKVA